MIYLVTGGGIKTQNTSTKERANKDERITSMALWMR